MSQPAIVQCSDGAFYVIKCLGFPGANNLMSEAVGSELIALLGLPSPRWVPIELSDGFILRNRGLWFRSGNILIPPRRGLHFGSRLIEAEDDNRTYQMVPHSWIGRIENRSDFLGMLILDLWANNCDRRQAVYLADRECRLNASFIDNGLMFGGSCRNDVTCPRRAMTCDLDVYKDLWDDNNDDVVKGWLERIERVGEDAIRCILSTVPHPWVESGFASHIINQLAERRQRVPRLLNEAKVALDSTYSIRYHKTRNATEPGQILTSSVLATCH